MINKDLMDVILKTISECYKINKEVINENFVDTLIGKICVGENYGEPILEEDKTKIRNCVQFYLSSFGTSTCFMDPSRIDRENLLFGIQVINFASQCRGLILQDFSSTIVHVHLAVNSQYYGTLIPILIKYMIDNQIMGKIFIEQTYNKYITLYLLKEDIKKIHKFCNDNQELLSYHMPFINYNSPYLVETGEFDELAYKNFCKDTCKFLAQGIDYNRVDFTDNILSLNFLTNHFLNVISKNMHNISKENKKSLLDKLQVKITRSANKRKLLKLGNRVN